MFFGKNLIFLKVGLVFFVSSKENVFSNMDTLYLRENENQGHMKKKTFFLGGDTSYLLIWLVYVYNIAKFILGISFGF